MMAWIQDNVQDGRKLSSHLNYLLVVIVCQVI
jgi:hypothetical protein